MLLFFILILFLAAVKLVVQSYIKWLYFFLVSMVNIKIPRGKATFGNAYPAIHDFQTSTIIFIFGAWKSVENLWTTSFCFSENTSFRYWRCTYKYLVILGTFAFEQLVALQVCDFSPPCYTYPPLGIVPSNSEGMRRE